MASGYPIEQRKYKLSGLGTKKTSVFNPTTKALIHFEISKISVCIAITNRIRSWKIIGGPMVARNMGVKMLTYRDFFRESEYPFTLMRNVIEM